MTVAKAGLDHLLFWSGLVVEPAAGPRGGGGGGGGGGRYRSRSPPRHSRRRSYSRSRSPAPRRSRGRSYSRSPARSISRSASPRRSPARSYSRSPARSVCTTRPWQASVASFNGCPVCSQGCVKECIVWLRRLASPRGWLMTGNIVMAQMLSASSAHVACFAADVYIRCYTVCH